VAREAADVVLADDDFATIVRAVGEGRVLFTNLRKAVRYYLACKAALAAVVLLSVLLGLSVPFAPVQIIVMELFMDLAASAAFVAEPGEDGLMGRPPAIRGRAFSTAPWWPASSRPRGASSRPSRPRTSGAGPMARPTRARWPSSPGCSATWPSRSSCAASTSASRGGASGRTGVMVAWGLATAAFVLLAVRVPALRVALKTAPLTAADGAGAVAAVAGGVAFVEWAKRRGRFDSPAVAD